MAIRFIDEQTADGGKIRFIDEPQRQTVSPRDLAMRAAMASPVGMVLGNLDLAMPFSQGLSFGLGNKALGGLSAVGGKAIGEVAELLGADIETPSLGELYRGNVERGQRNLEQVREDKPIAATAAEIGGGIAGAIGATGTAPLRALGNLAGRYGLAGRIGAGALGGETAQRVYEAGTAPIGGELEILSDPRPSLGGVLGGAVPAVGAGIRGISGALSPAVSEMGARASQLANKFDVPLGLDDVADSNFYKTLISEGQNMPFAGAGTSAPEIQLKAFTRAVAKQIGLDDASRLTPTAMDEAFDKAGKQFDNLTKGKVFAVSDDAMEAMQLVEEGVSGGSYGESGRKLFDKYVGDIFGRVKGAELGGDDLVALRNKFARISRKGANPEAKQMAKDFENVLIDMIGEDAPEAMRQAKHTYKNLIAVEPLASKVQSTGLISPAQLTNRMRTVYGRQFTRGNAGDLGELAELGQFIKQTIPNSGTAQRQAAQAITGQRGLDLAALGGGFINPAIPAAYYGTKGLGMLGNRALQSRNVNPETVRKAIAGQRGLTIPANSNTLRTGAALGTLTAQ